MTNTTNFPVTVEYIQGVKLEGMVRLTPAESEFVRSEFKAAGEMGLGISWSERSTDDPDYVDLSFESLSALTVDELARFVSLVIEDVNAAG